MSRPGSVQKVVLGLVIPGAVLLDNMRHARQQAKGRGTSRRQLRGDPVFCWRGFSPGPEFALLRRHLTRGSAGNSSPG